MPHNRIIASAIACFLASGLTAADEKKPGVTDRAELSYVFTRGNSENNTFAMKNQFQYTWTAAALTFDAGMLRASSSTRILTNAAGEVLVDKVSATTSELYEMAAQYKRNISPRLYWYGSGGWLRNRLVGYDNRYDLGAGLGYAIYEDDRQSLVGETGIGWVGEDFVNNRSGSFADYRAFLGYRRELSANASFENLFELRESLSNFDDVRVTNTASVLASITSRMALKVSYKLAFDNEPVVIDVVDPLGVSPVGRFTFAKTDSYITASLVINIK